MERTAKLQPYESTVLELNRTPLVTSESQVLRRTMELEYLSLGSYVRLCVLISILIGISVSTSFFAMDVMGVDTSFHWGDFAIPRTLMGIVALLVGPFVFGVVGFVGALITHPLFLWALRTYSGLLLTGVWLEHGQNQAWKKDPAEN